MKLHICRFPLVLGVLALGSLGSALQGQEAEAQKETQPGKALAEQNVESRRQALQLLAEAEIALEGGHIARATALAREAQRLYPESKAIAGFLASFQPDAIVVRAPVSTHNRAKAHLAAALSRAQVLMQQRRYTESLDLLNGIVEAADKFPDGSDVSLYRDLAQKELIEYRVGVQVGKIRPSNETPAPRPAVVEHPLSSPTDAEFTAAPSNAFRLARIARDQTPPWFSKIKTALRRNMTVNYNAMPLGLVLDDIQEKTGVPVIIDAPIQGAKTTMTAIIDLRVGTVPAETILYLATQVAGCEYVLLERGILITTADKAGDYIRNLPDAVANQWARARYLFPDLYIDAMATRPLPEARPSIGHADERTDSVPVYLRSGRDLVGHIEQLIR
jgi:hypothetical protein